MTVGTLIKTKASSTASTQPNGVFKAYDVPGGKAITVLNPNTVIGLYNTEKLSGFTRYYYIKLLEAITYQGKTYSYIWIEASKVFAYTPSMVPYFVTGASAVNVRSEPKLNAKTLLGSLKKGKLVGGSDGTTRNGYMFMKLATPLKGYNWAWVSKNYLTTRDPNTGTTPASTSGGSPAVVSDPQDAPVTSKVETILENTFGDGTAELAKWAGIGLLAAGLAFLIVRLLNDKD
nr:hypothetical protein [uncultured Arsenicibacter sp.]